MIDARKAVEAAVEYFNSLANLSDAALSPDLTLEEVELGEIGMEDRSWLITLGYNVKLPGAKGETAELLGPIMGLGKSAQKRRFKIFKINAETGDVLSMKMRENEQISE